MRYQTFFVCSTLAAAGCAHAPPMVDGVASVASSSGTLWTPPPSAITRTRVTGTRVPRDAAVPADLAARVRQLTIADVTDLALRNNPATRASWEQARAAAYAYGGARTRVIPSVDATTSAARSRSAVGGSNGNGSTGGTGAARPTLRTTYGPQLTLDYLLFDFGGRSGAIESARERLFAAGFSHNATLQNTVLQVQTAYFTYMATKSLLGALQLQLREAQANLAAAQQRHDVGLATIADVLQARTAVSEVELSIETAQGDVQAARGTLAAAMGLPPNLPYDVEALPANLPVRAVATSIDSLIEVAVAGRPDLQAAQADARAAAAQVGVTRAAGLPSLTLGGNTGRTYASPSTTAGPTYGLSLGLRIPLVSTLTNRYSVRTAEAQAAAAAAQAEGVRQEVVREVFTSYYALQTATQRVVTADALLAAAVQSEQVAAGRYREGVGNIIDLLTAQSALANARAQQVQARWQWSTALARLAHDAGVLGLRGEAPVGLSATPAEQDTTPTMPAVPADSTKR